MLRAAGHRAPVTVACGVWSLLSAAVGAVSTCLTGPTNALLTASGERHRHYMAGIVCGLLAMLFGLFVPLFTRLMLAVPAAFVAALGELAMLRVLQTAFTTSFGGPVHVRLVRDVRGDGFERHRAEHRRCLLGAPGRARGVVAAGARRPASRPPGGHRAALSDVASPMTRGARRNQPVNYVLYPSRRTLACARPTAKDKPFTCRFGFAHCQVGCTAQVRLPPGAPRRLDSRRVNV